MTQSNGRPSGYQPEYPQQLFDLMKQGQKGAALHAHFGISAKCFWDWKKRYPEFNEAYDRGLEECRKWWDNFGIQKMIEGDEKGYKYWRDFMANNFSVGRYGEATSNNINITNLQINNLSKDELIKQLERDLKDLNILDTSFEEVKTLPDESKE